MDNREIVSELKNKTLKVKLAENQYEIEKALALRFEIFNKELGEGLPESYNTGKDRDKYDYFCDHLIVIDSLNNNQVVGTYRILRSSIAKKTLGFYSENEFDLFNLYQIPYEIAEVGRSCVHSNYRDGSVINLLWQGLSSYMNLYNIQFYFGCASVHSTSLPIIVQVYNYLLNKNAFADLYIPSYNNNYSINIIEPDYIDPKIVPPLIKGYLRLGAQFSPYPSTDLVFGTTDFFVIFNREHISKKYSSKYHL